MAQNPAQSNYQLSQGFMCAFRHKCSPSQRLGLLLAGFLLPHSSPTRQSARLPVEDKQLDAEFDIGQISAAAEHRITTAQGMHYDSVEWAACTPGLARR